MPEDLSIPQLVDHLFRHQVGQMISSLTRHFGVENLELVEDIVQETLIKALQGWPYRGVPENPAGWLWKTAKNGALDRLRHESRLQKKLPALMQMMDAGEANGPSGHDDDQLSMMFIGCHPSLTREAQVAFVLKTVGGFSVAEIARAFLQSESTVAQRLVRAKNKLRAEAVRFELPGPDELNERLEAVLQVLYLLFNEGYEASSGRELIRADLCHEAIYLCRLAASHPVVGGPAVHALLALMLLQSSRLDARTNAHGDVLLLSEQDRSLWDRTLISEGIRHLERSAQGQLLSKYHLEAGIAAKHAVAESFEGTDWSGILEDYDALCEIGPTPVILLNRAVAAAMVHGPQRGLDELSRLKEDQALRRYHLLPATFGELYERNGDHAQAAQSYRLALTLTTNDVERRFLQRKLSLIKDQKTIQR